MRNDPTGRMIIMVDLETCGTETASPIFDIGIAVAEANLDYVISASTLVKPDMAFACPDTMQWGEKQPAWQGRLAKAQKHGADSVRTGLAKTLSKLSTQLEDSGRWKLRDLGGNNVEWWANAPTFDLAMLRHHLGDTKVWNFWQERCFRTARSEFREFWPEVAAPVTHRARDDAHSQLEQLRAAQNRFRRQLEKAS